MQAEFAQLLTPTALATTAGVLALLAISHFFGIGEIIDIVLVVVGVAFLGVAAFDVASHLIDCVSITADATTRAELDEAAEHLAYVVAIIGVAAFLALLRKARASRSGPGRKQPPKSRSQPEAPPRQSSPRPPGPSTPAPSRPQPPRQSPPPRQPKPAPGSFPTRTRATGPKGGKPTGKRPNIPPSASPAHKRGIRRERESAERLADEGYRVKHLEAGTTKGVKNPDFEIEGKVFDNYAPGPTRSARSVMDEVA